MKRTVAVAVSVSVAVTVAVAAAAELPYARGPRLERIEKSLQAFHEAKDSQASNLEKYLSSIAHGACRSDDDALAATCLEEHAGKNCGAMPGKARSRCMLMSDVIVTNLVNEKQFVSREERFNLMAKSGSASYSDVLSRIVLRKYALVATELLLSQPSCDVAGVDEPACLARNIDEYCLRHADVRNLPWQGCVSSIVWFMGTTP